jgi:hypothetical protein
VQSDIIACTVRWTIVVPFGILAAILLLPSPIQARADDSQSAASLDRIRAALEQPPPVLRLPEPSAETPTFRIEVRAPAFVLEPIDEQPFDPTFGLPSAGELLMDGIDKIRSAVVRYKRKRAERRARKEVDDAMAAFCAIHECPAPDTTK